MTNKDIENIRKIYDNHAQTYKDNTYNDNGYLTPIYEAFLSKINGNKILDAGCGNARDVEYFINNNYDAYGIDLSEKMLSLAQVNTKNKLTCGDLLKLDEYYTQSSFDGLWTIGGIVHLEKSDAIKCIKHFHTVLKQGGTLCLCTKLQVDPGVERIEKESLSTPGINKKYLYYKPKEMIEILKKIGFKDIRFFESESYLPNKDTIKNPDLWGVFIGEK